MSPEVVQVEHHLVGEAQLAPHVDRLLAVQRRRAEVAREVVDERAHLRPLERRRAVVGQELLGLLRGSASAVGAIAQAACACARCSATRCFSASSLAVAHDPVERVEPLERALEVPLPRRQLGLGEEHRLQELLVRRRRWPRPPRAAAATPRCAAPPRGAAPPRRAPARARRASPAASTRSMTRVAHLRRRPAPSGRGAPPTRAARATPRAPRAAACDGIGQGDGPRVVARRRLELARLEPPLAALREVRRRALAVARLVEVPGDARRVLPRPVAERRLQRVPRGGVHLARGLVGQRVDHDLGDDRRREPQLARPRVRRAKSRSLSVASERSSAGIACPSMLDEHGHVDRIAQDRRRLQRRAVLRREARDARRDEAAQRLRQREVLPDELHRHDPPVGDRDRAARRRAP